MLIFPPGHTPSSIASENAAIKRYFEDIAGIRSRLGKPTTVQDEAKRFTETFKPGASMLERLRSLKLIETQTPVHVQAQGVRQ